MTKTSLILPTYNEATTINRFLRELTQVLSKSGRPYEIILCDDDSPDDTAQVVEKEFSKESPVRVIRRTGSRGLGFSIREGIENAKGETLVVMDADFNHDPQVVPFLIKYLEDFDLVSGSRFAPGGSMYSAFRHYGSFAVNLFLRVVLRTQVQDSLCGFFAMRREALERLPFDQIFWGHGDYYFRLLFYAQRRGVRILEIPTVYRSREGGVSKTPLFRTALKYLKEIILLRIRYRKPPGGDQIAEMTYDQKPKSRAG